MMESFRIPHAGDAQVDGHEATVAPPHLRARHANGATVVAKPIGRFDDEAAIMVGVPLRRQYAGRRIADDGDGVHAEDALGLGVEVRDAAIGTDCHDAIGNGVQHGANMILAPCRYSFGLQCRFPRRCKIACLTPLPPER